MEMNQAKQLMEHRRKLAVVGMGYVGLPLALAFAKHFDVIGFDVNEAKIHQYRSGADPTGEVGCEALRTTACHFTSNPEDLKEAGFYIISVPTPVDEDNQPDFSCLISASRIVGNALKPGDIVVYESTVFPGATEEICIPELEIHAGLSCPEEFKVGYSPERINPSDKVNRVDTIVKIVSGIDEPTLEEISQVYNLVVKAGVYKAPAIKVAEAAKVAENSQRDINIAFMNELARSFDHMGIDTQSVIQAMKTKWNALDFQPGLVGGHCISIDPYYFIYKSNRLGVPSRIHTTARSINEGMPEFVVQKLVRLLIEENHLVKGAKVAVLGITYKENCPDLRNSKAVKIVRIMEEVGIIPYVFDPVASNEELAEAYGITLQRNYDLLNEMDAVILAVAHTEFLTLSLPKTDNKTIILDVKGTFQPHFDIPEQVRYWRL